MQVVGDGSGVAFPVIFDHPETDHAPDIAIDRRAMPEADSLAEIQSGHAGVAKHDVEQESITQGHALLVNLSQPYQEIYRRGIFGHRFIFQVLSHALCHALAVAENHGCNNKQADEE